jgi:Kef-type K+ transport system membrane component KefB
MEIINFFNELGNLEFFRELSEFLSTHIVFNIGLLLIVGYFFGKLAHVFKLPSITGYILAGLIVGHSFLHLVTHEMKDTLNSITEVALGLIALTIGAEFKLSKLKIVGFKILLLTLFEAIFAFFAVTLTMSLLGLDIKYALILGAISSATAPAATVVLIRQLRARGSFVDFLYGVVAFDDAVCVILFSIVFSVVAPLLVVVPGVESGVLTGFLHAFKELFFSVLIGFLSGILIHFVVRRKYKKNEILIITIGMVFVSTALAIAFHLSPLIANMILGMTLVNISGANSRIFSILEPITPPLFALFFILAGLELNVDVILKGSVLLYGIFYIISRFLGKLVGIYTASFITVIPEKIKKYLGLCLFPQAGVAIGLVLFIKTSPVLDSAPPEVRITLDMLLNVVLVSVFINELVGPSISRIGIVKGAQLDNRK